MKVSWSSVISEKCERECCVCEDETDTAEREREVLLLWNLSSRNVECSELVFSRLSLAGVSGSLQIWYKLKQEKEPDVFMPTGRSLANGQLHRVQLHREGRDMYVQVRMWHLLSAVINAHEHLLMSLPVSPQVDKDVSRKFVLSTDRELNMIRSLTLGKVTRRKIKLIFIIF